MALIINSGVSKSATIYKATASFGDQTGATFNVTVNISENPNYANLTSDDLYCGFTEYQTYNAAAGSIANVSIAITNYNATTGDVTLTVSRSSGAGSGTLGTVFVISA